VRTLSQANNISPQDTHARHASGDAAGISSATFHRPTQSVGICGQADVARSRCWSCRMPSSGVSLLAMTPKSDHRHALGSRLRLPNWPCGHCVGRRLRRHCDGTRSLVPSWGEQVHEPIIWPEGRLRRGSRVRAGWRWLPHRRRLPHAWWSGVVRRRRRTRRARWFPGAWVRAATANQRR
jgi:hypothetical protein